MSIPPYPGPPAGQYPGYPGQFPGANQLPQKPKAPPTVLGAFLLYIVGAVFSVLSVLLVMGSPVFDRMLADAANRSDLSGTAVNTVISTARTLVIGVGVLFAALFLTFALVMYLGHNWARIVLTVFSALALSSAVSGGVASTATVNSQSYDLGVSWAGWVQGGVAVVAIVLMYLAPSNQYFTQARIARKGR